MSEEKRYSCCPQGAYQADWDEIGANTLAARNPLVERAKVRFALIRDAI